MSFLIRKYHTDGNDVPTWPFEVNWGSPQARGLKFWLPAQDFSRRDLVGHKDLTILPTTLLGTHEFNTTVWEAPGSEGLATVVGSADGDLDFGLADPFTLVCWVDIPATDGTIFSKAGNTVTQRQYQIFNLTGTIDFRIHGASIASLFAVEGEGPSLIGLTKSGAEASNDVSVYKNGIFVSTATAGTDTTNNADVLIGARRATDLNEADFAFTAPAGYKIWDVRIHNVALTDTEMYHAWVPETRWDLRRPTGRRSLLSEVAAVAGVGPHNPLGHPLYGPLAGPIMVG